LFGEDAAHDCAFVVVEHVSCVREIVGGDVGGFRLMT